MPSTSRLPILREKVVIRLAGDSGDGMQLTGSEFTRSSALAGNDLATFPDFPAEIRAPAGTIAGVSGFQLHFGSTAIYTPGDTPDVLVCMNPAAFKKNIGDLKLGGTVIANQDAFNKANLRKIDYAESPLEDSKILERYNVIAVDMEKQVQRVLEGQGLSTKEIARTKNFWALGLLYWLYNHPTDKQIEWIGAKFKKKPQYAKANIDVFKAGYHFGDTTELFGETYQVDKAPMEKGIYRNITGNMALALGLVTAGQKCGREMILGTYPITPASDILHNLAKFRNYGVKTFQAEDEIAAVCVAIGASYGGAIGMTSTSGPGLALKGEALGLAHIIELPLIVLHVQRGGPSTGLPTKTEQSDLMQVMYGRNGDAPIPVIAPNSPADCFTAAIEATRVAIKYMTPVVVMSDGYLANGAEPWKIPNPDDIKPFKVSFHSEKEGYQVYKRDAETLARKWVIPGTPELEHRVGGLEKDINGEVSYEPENHQMMCDLRAEKIQRIQSDIAPLKIEGDIDADLVVVGWGGTYGSLKAGIAEVRKNGQKVAHIHLRWLNPFSSDLKKALSSYSKVLICELNSGQLSKILRAEYLVDAKSFNKLQGQPFLVQEVTQAIEKELKSS